MTSHVVHTHVFKRWAIGRLYGNEGLSQSIASTYDWDDPEDCIETRL